MAILSKAYKAYNFKSHNSLKLSFMNIPGLCVNFMDCRSFLESNSPEILVLRETNLDDSVGSDNFSVRGYLPLIGNDSGTHMCGLTVYVQEGLPFPQDLSLQIFAYVFDWLYFTQSVTSFSTINHLLHLCARF